MGPKIERIGQISIVGEGPHWDVEQECLYYVDVFGKAIYRYEPSTNQHYKAVIGDNLVSVIIPIEGTKDKFLLSNGDHFLIIQWDGVSEKVSTVKKICEPKEPNLRYNDAKCDSSGRLWAGTVPGGNELKLTPDIGVLYSIDSDKVLKEHVKGVSGSNGLAFSELHNKFFYVQSFKGTVDRYDFNVATGTIANGEVFFTLKDHGIEGLPDGITIDTDGNIWVAVFNGHCVIKIDGSKPETLIETIKVPAKQAASVAFGGKNLDVLYVTTGSLTFQGEECPPPDNGALYKITGTGSKGYPGVKAKINF